MITEFILQNRSSMQSAKFGQDIDCDFVYLEDGGIDWGNISADHNTYSYPNQVGSTISNTKLLNRDITIEAYAYYILSEDEKSSYDRSEWPEIGYEKIKEKKGILNTLINPQNYIRLTINDYYIEGKPSATPRYGTVDRENNIYFCKFMINIFCDNPMFKKATKTQTIVSGDFGVFHFPFVLEPDGDILGTRLNYLILIVENEGNASIGAKIILKSQAIIKNPVIENISTGEKIKINKTMQPGEVIEINTNDGNEKGIIGTLDGVTSDYLQYWDFNNDWMKFEAGSSVVGYSTENQMESALDISIDLNPEKFGLEDM